jgi:hypothetical protein
MVILAAGMTDVKYEALVVLGVIATVPVGAAVRLPLSETPAAAAKVPAGVAVKVLLTVMLVPAVIAVMTEPACRPVPAMT